MEPPVRTDSESIRDEKVKVLKAIPDLIVDDVVRGQFRGYRSEKGVAADSQVETFVALRLWIDSWRWQGVPFYIRAGKNLPVTCTEVLVRLRQPPTMYREFRLDPNHCRFWINPDITFAIGANVIAPGQETSSTTAEMVGTDRLKEDLLAGLRADGHDVVDFGAGALNPDDDYPDLVIPLAQAVAAGTLERGIAVCGSGVGASICANKVPGAHAALIHEHFSAAQGVEDDHMNVICIGGRTIGPEAAWDLAGHFWPLNSAMRRVTRRLSKVAQLELQSMRTGK